MQDDQPHQPQAPGAQRPYAAAHGRRRVVIVERFLTHYRVAFY
jgi:hypothetical protein